jgi:type I restriction enzyme S subunit
MEGITGMSHQWKMVRLGEVLSAVARPVAVSPDDQYRQIGIRSHGKGVFHKAPVSGIELGNKKVFWVEPGDFIVNIVFAWEGAIALMTDHESGMIGSHRFPTFRADDKRLHPQFLVYFFNTPAGLDLLGRVSPGGAGRNRTLSKTAFLQQEIPLPPLAEQRRIVARIEALAAEIAEARRLRREALAEAEAMVGSRIRSAVETTEKLGTLGEVLLEKPRNGWSARCDNAEGGTAILSLGSVTGFHYKQQFKRTSVQVSEEGHYWLRAGDLLMTRSNTPELVGHAAIYDGNPQPCIFPDLMMRLEVNAALASPHFVWRWLMSPVAREYVMANARGTSPTMKKISQGTVMDLPFPSKMPLPEQRRIVAELDALQAEVNAMKHLQSETAVELDALLPSILDRAFKGEL